MKRYFLSSSAANRNIRLSCMLLGDVGIHQEENYGLGIVFKIYRQVNWELLNVVCLMRKVKYHISHVPALLCNSTSVLIHVVPFLSFLTSASEANKLQYLCFFQQSFLLEILLLLSTYGILSQQLRVWACRHLQLKIWLSYSHFMQHVLVRSLQFVYLLFKDMFETSSLQQYTCRCNISILQIGLNAPVYSSITYVCFHILDHR